MTRHWSCLFDCGPDSWVKGDEAYGWDVRWIRLHLQLLPDEMPAPRAPRASVREAFDG